jgi:hypothetical protein
VRESEHPLNAGIIPLHTARVSPFLFTASRASILSARPRVRVGQRSLQRILSHARERPSSQLLERRVAFDPEHVRPPRKRPDIPRRPLERFGDVRERRTSASKVRRDRERHSLFVDRRYPTRVARSNPAGAAAVVVVVVSRRHLARERVKTHRTERPKLPFKVRTFRA